MMAFKIEQIATPDRPAPPKPPTPAPPVAETPAAPAAPAPSTETPAPAVAPAAPAQPSATSPEIAAILKRERQSVQAAQLAKKEKEEAAKLRQEAEAEAARIKKLKEDARLNPLSYLQEAGLTMNDLVAFGLNNGQPTEGDKIKALEDRLSRIVTEQEQRAKEQAERAKADEAERVKQQEASNRQTVKSYIEQQADTYPIVAAAQLHNTVFDVIMEQYRQNGQADLTKACELVEQFYATVLQQDKIKQKYFSQVIPSAPTETPTTDIETPGIQTANLAQTKSTRTLTVQDTATSGKGQKARTSRDTAMAKALELAKERNRLMREAENQ